MSDLFKALLPIPYGLVMAAALFLELGAWNSRKQAIALRGEKGVRALVASLAEKWGWSLSLTGICLAGWDDSDREILYVAIGMGSALVCVLAALGIPWWARLQRKKGPEPLQISQGALFDGIEAVRLKAGIGSPLKIYVLPEGYQAQSEDYVRMRAIKIFMPRRLLDWMSRAEIDALAAYQLAWPQTRRYVGWTLLGIFIYGLMASVILTWLKIGPRGRWEAFLVLLIIEITALACLRPRLRYLADLRTIALTGNPEAYFSAMAELSRLSSGVLDTRSARRFARTGRISSDWLLKLRERHRPPEDRYPLPASI
jgi:hypothetical protein